MLDGPLFGNRVLIWLDNTLSGVSAIELAGIYTAMGIPVDFDTTWTGDLSDYWLIHWPDAISDPVWWPFIVSGTWTGRLNLTCDGDPGGGFAASTVNYVNGLSALTGVSATIDSLDTALGGVDSPTIANALTAGQAVLRHDLVSQLSGGTVLSRTVTGSHPWLCRNTKTTADGTIDFVISADAAYMADGGVAFPTNTRFFQNLWNVPLS
jgi:hypothetical protein